MWAFLLALFISVICWFWIALFPPSSDPYPSVNLQEVGKGPLSLIKGKIGPKLEPFVHELMVLGVNSRPDGAKVRLRLKTSGVEKEVPSGETVHLTEELSFMPIVLDQEVLVKAGEEEALLSPSDLFQKPLAEEGFVQALRKATMWPPDLLDPLIGKQKVEIDGRVFFLSLGDSLWWDGAEWQEGMGPTSSPMAQLASSDKMQVWDESGYSTSMIQIPRQNVSTPLRADELITSIRFRSPGEISCQLGKRRVIVKEGDWWVKTAKRWRPLRTAQDLEAFLRHEIQGDLFIFEKIEGAKHQVVVKGKSFDKMRSTQQPLSLVVQTEKKTHLSSRKSEKTALIAKNRDDQ